MLDRDIGPLLNGELDQEPNSGRPHAAGQVSEPRDRERRRGAQARNPILHLLQSQDRRIDPGERIDRPRPALHGAYPRTATGSGLASAAYFRSSPSSTRQSGGPDKAAVPGGIRSAT